jgi:predicted amidohydrolase
MHALAAAQTAPVAGDVAANVQEHLRLARIAAAEGAALVLFPELSLTGYEIGLAESLAFSQHDARLAPLRDAAEGLRVTLVVGAPIRVGTALHIGAFIVSPDGSTEVYTKRHLGAFRAEDAPDGVVPPPEHSVFREGTLDPLLRLGDHVAAMSICADSRHASHAERAAGRGADTYLSSQFAIVAHLPHKLSLLKKYAAAHRMTIVLSNFGGPTGGLPSAGSSGIWSDRGECLVKLDSEGPGLAIALEEAGGFRTRAVMS